MTIEDTILKHVKDNDFISINKSTLDLERRAILRLESMNLIVNKKSNLYSLTEIGYDAEQIGFETWRINRFKAETKKELSVNGNNNNINYSERDLNIHSSVPNQDDKKSTQNKILDVASKIEVKTWEIVVNNILKILIATIFSYFFISKL